jgi:sporulation protein YlmC with PRC-barrel domain
MHEFPQVLSATSLVGNKVINRSGQELGSIKELMIDLDEGSVAYAVLSYGGVMGIGDKLFAIPWEAMDLDTEQHVFILNVDKAALDEAPGFDKDNWPDNAQYEEKWLVDISENIRAHQADVRAQKEY